MYNNTGGAKWCKPVNEAKKSEKVRASISLPSDQYALLEKLAEEKKVSIAWVVRDAVELYLNERWPLISGRFGSD